jgi:predicted extracellular nuclease
MLSKVLPYRIIFVLALLCHFSGRGYSQAKTESVRIMFYNVENLFDYYNDTTRDDDDFLPEGLMRWNASRYNRKLNSLYKTIIAAGEWNAPGVVALCEVENRKILDDLIYRTYLFRYNYGIIHEDSPDTRGIDVCLIYRKDIAKIAGYSYWIPGDVKMEDYRTRSVLCCKIVIGQDTLHLIVNHWPSRRGGVLAMEGLRIKVAEMVRMKADSIMKASDHKARIIILGDFNSTPDDQEMKILTSPDNDGTGLINLSEKLSVRGEGTYRYNGTWEMIDQVLVSDFILRCRSGIYTSYSDLKVFRPEFLLYNDPVYAGHSPFSTYRGYRYQGGYSDHLPVILDLRMRQDLQPE